MITQLFTLENLTQETGILRVPWNFEFAPQSISLEVRQNKKERQKWLRNPGTKHCFYSAVIGQNESIRVTKDNPPKKRVAFVADYDCPLSNERILEAMNEMPVKPTYVETSIGGHRRLFWGMDLPIYCDTREFDIFISQRARKWLRLDLLPALDEAAWEDPTRLLCCGDLWENTQSGPIPEAASQEFFVGCGKAYDFKVADPININLDVVEAELKKKYPAYSWPGELTLESQGPSFWVEGSQSTHSAIVKPDGMFTFAAHAEKAFYNWGDLLGQEFVKEFRQQSISRATADIWFDGQRYHRKGLDGNYRSMSKDDFILYLQNACQLSTKADNTGRSPINQCLWHVQQHQFIAGGAGPHVPLPKGIIYFQDKRCLNIYDRRPVQPSAQTQYWGPGGTFAFYTALWETQFYPRLQMEYHLAWYKYFYEGVLAQVCRPGCMTILMGPPGCGKTLINRYIVGTSVGGFADAAQFILDSSEFNSENFHMPFLALDDDTPNASNIASNIAHLNIKKLLANDVFKYHKKYEVPAFVQWGGRLGATANLDAASARIIGPADDAIRDRISLFRCSNWGEEKGGFQFPERAQTMQLLTSQMPNFLRWLIDWKVPDHIPVDRERWGFKAYHEPSLLELADQTSPAAPFKEIVLSTLSEFFQSNPDAKEWRGSSHELLQLITGDPRNFTATRSLRSEQVNHRMEQLSKEKVLGCTWETEPRTKIRVWVFRRPT